MAATTLAVAGLAAGAYQANRADKTAKEAIKAGDPFGPYRAGYAEQLASLMRDPATYAANDPGYKFNLEQGQQALERSQAAKGFTGSGNAAIELLQYAQGYATDYLTKQKEFLAGLAGSGIAPNPNAGVTAANNSFERWGGLITSAGEVAGTFGKKPNVQQSGAPAPSPATAPLYNPGFGGVGP